jgi:hypothetical protein
MMHMQTLQKPVLKVKKKNTPAELKDRVVNRARAKNPGKSRKNLVKHALPDY